jgi:hypothetical protein
MTARKLLSDFVSYIDFFCTTSISTINFDVSRKGRMPVSQESDTSISTINLNFDSDVSRKGRMPVPVTRSQESDSLQLPLDNVDKVSLPLADSDATTSIILRSSSCQ